MANTYTQIHVHVVFAVESRQNLIQHSHKVTLERYIGGIIRNKKQKLIVISCMPDHTHILVGLRPEMALSDLVRDIKNNASRFINEEMWTAGKFRWQEGFGAFSYGYSQVSAIAGYIENQEAHHKKSTFLEEYRDMLEKFNVQYDDRYLFRESDGGKRLPQ